MANLELLKISLENSLELIEQKMKKLSSYNISANELSKYIPFIEDGGYGYSESKKKEELKRLRNSVTYSAIKTIKIADLINKEIDSCTNILKNNKKTIWFSSLFNRVADIKNKLKEQIFDAKHLKDKFDNKNIDFKSVTLEENDYTIRDYDIVQMGITFNDFHFAFFNDLLNKYGKADQFNKVIINNEYTQRCSSFDLNRKLRKNQLLNKNENKIYSALNNACYNNKLDENIYLFGYVSQEFINKYDIKFDRLSQSSIINAIFKFKKNIIDKEIIEKEYGFISSSCDLEKNVFKSRDVLLVLYVEKGCNLYVTNNMGENEIILPTGMIYHFFDCFFIEVKLLAEKFYQMVIKILIKNNN